MEKGEKVNNCKLKLKLNLILKLAREFDYKNVKNFL